MNIFPELTDGGLFARGMAMTEALNARYNQARGGGEEGAKMVR